MSATQTQYFQFGAGFVFGVPTAGNLAATPTAQQFLTIQEASMDITREPKELRGNLQAPDDVAASDVKITGKISIGRMDLNTLNQLFFAETVGANPEACSPNEAGTIPSSSVYTITVVNSAAWTEDLGVRYASDGSKLTNVGSASLTAAGQYKVAAGVYTFDVADAGLGVLISYLYTNTAGGIEVIMTNRPQGYGPIVELYFDQPYRGLNGVHLYYARLNSIKMPTKRNDYVIAEVDYEAFANPAGNILAWSQGVTG
jgi:hypothetical protein